jgi:putative ABC transport system substrate-binding protein
MSPGDIPPYDLAFLRGLQEQGYILPGEIPRFDEAYWKALVSRGHFEGKKLRIEIRTTGQRLDRAPALADELVALKVDAIYAVPTLLAKAAQDAARKATRPIPVVFAVVFDPVGFGLVDSLAHPGGNTTGVANVDPEFHAKLLEVLKETFPHVSRVAYLTDSSWDPKYSELSKPLMEGAARQMSVQLDTFDVNSVDEIENALSEIVRRRVQAIVLPMSPFLYAHRARIIDFAAKRRLPAIYGDAIWVDDGGLMFYGDAIGEQKRRSAAVVAKVLRGVRPADIPVEQPSTYKLVINLKTAKALGLSIPNEIVMRADRVIK